ncbi:MAG: beta-methylgalactoside transporter permease, partial [Synergistaceae bacterium]|nr:beta-methylgalactoside transporter permease [Synergistaceae bacterium]
MAENTRSRSKLFTVSGLIILVLGIALYFLKSPMGLRRIYDLPIFLIIIGLCSTISGFMSKGKPDDVLELSGKAFGEFLTNNAILLAMLVLVVVICILQPRF